MSDRDRAIERLLRARVDRPSAADDPECFSAETVAAWADGTMNERSSEQVEAHAADCTRCQALLAAVVLTESDPEPAPSVWIGWVRWLVPLAAGVTAVALWVVVPGRQAGPDVARLNAPAGDSVAASAETEDVAVELPAEADMGPASTMPPESVLREVDEPAGTASSSTPGEARERAAAAQPASEPDSPGSSGAGTPQGQGGREETVVGAEVARRSQAQTENQRAPAAAKAAQAVASGLSSPAEAIVEQPTFADRLDGRLEVSAAGETIRWRLGSNSDVELSTDGGLTWSPRPTGMGVAWLAGAAPAARVCWLVGRGGAIVLTTDAESWRRIPFPESVDLLGIQASDAELARVTTEDGRTFTTTNGGASWTEAAAP